MIMKGTQPLMLYPDSLSDPWYSTGRYIPLTSHIDLETQMLYWSRSQVVLTESDKFASKLLWLAQRPPFTTGLTWLFFRVMFRNEWLRKIMFDALLQALHCTWAALSFVSLLMSTVQKNIFPISFKKVSNTSTIWIVLSVADKTCITV